MLLAGVLLLGLFLQHSGIIDIRQELERTKQMATLWWAPLFFVLLQGALYTLAFPAAISIWVLGVVYTPWPATLIVVAGGLLGSVGAYYFTGFLSSPLREKFSHTQAYRMLHKNSGFFQLLAMRTLPGFPHLLINYSCGILQVPLAPYMTSTLLGFAFKGFIYTSAIYKTTHHLHEGAKLVSIQTIWPLVLLVLFSLAGILIQKKFFTNSC